MKITGQSFKEIVDTYYQNDLPKLQKYFNRFARFDETENFFELVGNLYIYTMNNQEKLNEVVMEGKYHFYCVQWIYNQRRWTGTEYKKNTKVIENNSTLLTDLDLYDIVDEYEDVLEREYDIQQKLALVRIRYNTLPYDAKVLYDKYYGNGNTMRAIAKEIGVSPALISQQVSKIRKYIKNGGTYKR